MVQNCSLYLSDPIQVGNINTEIKLYFPLFSLQALSLCILRVHVQQLFGQPSVGMLNSRIYYFTLMYDYVIFHQILPWLNQPEYELAEENSIGSHSFLQHLVTLAIISASHFYMSAPILLLPLVMIPQFTPLDTARTCKNLC